MNTVPAAADIVHCPQCRDPVDQHTNRLVLESCGHQKCRSCFIAESLGCRECRQNAAAAATIPNDHDEVETPLATQKFQILDDICLPPVQIHAQIDPKTTDNETGAKEEAVQMCEQPNKKKTSSSSSAEPFRYPAHLQVTRTGALVMFYCRICRKSFKSLNNRRYHLYCDTSIAKPLKCDQCDKRFITAGHLDYHRKVHQTPTASFACKSCAKSFLREGSLRKHCRKEHEGNFKHTCEQCGLKLQYKFELNTHKNKHEKKFPFRCSVCDKGFLLKCNLKQHIEMHKGTKAYGCDICDRRYAKKFSLKQHMLLHSKQDLQFTCTTCSKTFLTQRYLDRHSRCHNEKSLECTLCGTKGNRKDNMQRHLKDQHPHEDHNGLMAKIIEKSLSLPSSPPPPPPPPPPAQKSVIQFVGRSSLIIESKPTAPSHHQPLSINLTDESAAHHPQSRSAVPSLPNIQVYRKLLSPYLKTQTTELQRSGDDCPPPQLCSKDNSTATTGQQNQRSIAVAVDIKKSSVAVVGKRASQEHLAIYREILMPSNQLLDEDCAAVQPPAVPTIVNEPEPAAAAKGKTSLDVLAAAAVAKESDRRNFAEMHWRKRTSQCFSISQMTAKKD